MSTEFSVHFGQIICNGAVYVPKYVKYIKTQKIHRGCHNGFVGLKNLPNIEGKTRKIEEKRLSLFPNPQLSFWEVSHSKVHIISCLSAKFEQIWKWCFCVVHFSKMERFFRFSGFSSIFRPILAAAFDRAEKFYIGNVLLDIFLGHMELGATKLSKRSKNEEKNMENLKNS